MNSNQSNLKLAMEETHSKVSFCNIAMSKRHLSLFTDGHGPHDHQNLHEKFVGLHGWASELETEEFAQPRMLTGGDAGWWHRVFNQIDHSRVNISSEKTVPQLR